MIFLNYIFLLYFLSIGEFAIASGRTVGNGGDVLVCRNQDGTDSYELLDFYEGRALRNIQVDLGPAELTLPEKIEIALKRLERVSERRAKTYRTQAATFFQESLFLTDAGLIDVPDSDHFIIPHNCHLQQIANQSEPLYPEDKRYIIDQSLWNQLDKNNQVGLILHEIIYREALAIGQVNSISTRLLTSNISSLRINAMSTAEFTRFLTDLGFTSTTIQGIEVLINATDPIKTAPRFFPNGNLHNAWVSDSASLSWQNQKLNLRKTVDFNSEGTLLKTFIKENQKILWNSQWVQIAPYAIEFFANGQVKNVSLSTEWHWQNQTADVQLLGATSWFANGQLAQATVKYGRVAILKQWLEVQNLIGFFESGFAHEIELRKSWTSEWQGQNITWTGRIELNQDQQVIHGLLAQASQIQSHGSRIVFSPYYPLVFFDDAKEIFSGCLAEPIYLEVKDEGFKWIERGRKLVWDLQGQLKISYDSFC
jgi:hypothetical protein